MKKFIIAVKAIFIFVCVFILGALLFSAIFSWLFNVSSVFDSILPPRGKSLGGQICFSHSFFFLWFCGNILVFDKGFGYLNKSKKSSENEKDFNAGWIYVLLVVFCFIFGVAFFPLLVMAYPKETGIVMGCILAVGVAFRTLMKKMLEF